MVEIGIDRPVPEVPEVVGWQEAEPVEVAGLTAVPGGDPSGSGGAEGRGDMCWDPDAGEDAGDAEGVPHAWADTSVSVSEFGVSRDSVSDSDGAEGVGGWSSSSLLLPSGRSAGGVSAFWLIGGTGARAGAGAGAGAGPGAGVGADKSISTVR